MQVLDLVDRAEAARILGVSKPTIRRWAREGKMPPVAAMCNGRELYRRELVELDAERRASSTGD